AHGQAVAQVGLGVGGRDRGHAHLGGDALVAQAQGLLERDLVEGVGGELHAIGHHARPVGADLDADVEVHHPLVSHEDLHRADVPFDPVNWRILPSAPRHVASRRPHGGVRATGTGTRRTRMGIDFGWQALAWQGWATIGVVLATLGFLLWERFSPDKVLVGAMVVLVATGILGPREALAGYWNPGVLTVAVLFVLVAALKSTGAIRWIGDWVLGRPRSEYAAQARMVTIAAPLSAFINNTPIVAMLTSAVEHWSRTSRVPPSKLLMPMNYATVLGGMCTLLGTSTNLIVAGLVVQAGLAPLDMFDPLGVGAVAAIAGCLYLLTVGRWLLPV